MQETIEKAITDFIHHLSNISGDHIQKVSIIITGDANIADPSKEVQTGGAGIISIPYQTEHIPGSLPADVTFIIMK